MNYTLHQLQIFLKIVETQSITKASEELHLTQPAVSIQLRNFQAQFDIPLTEVVGRKIYITDFGKEIAVSAENIINQVYAINYKTLAHKGHLTGKLKISIVSTGKYVMPYFLSDFINQHDGIELLTRGKILQRACDKFDVLKPPVCCAFIGICNDCRRLIEAQNVPCLPNDFPCDESDVAGTTANVQDTHARLQTCFREKTSRKRRQRRA